MFVDHVDLNGLPKSTNEKKTIGLFSNFDRNCFEITFLPHQMGHVISFYHPFFFRQKLFLQKWDQRNLEINRMSTYLEQTQQKHMLSRDQKGLGRNLH